jgi:hypothetical protein
VNVRLDRKSAVLEGEVGDLQVCAGVADMEQRALLDEGKTALDLQTAVTHAGWDLEGKPGMFVFGLGFGIGHHRCGCESFPALVVGTYQLGTEWDLRL